jgi:fructokinase
VFPDQARFGGAPANFACHASALGARAAMISAVGPQSDPLAARALESLVKHRVDISAVARNEHETGRVLVELDSQGHASYRFSENPAWDYIDWSDAAAKIAQRTRAVCFGSLAQRHEHSKATIERFLAAVPAEAWRIFDVNLRINFWNDQRIVRSLSMANALKLNSDELPIVARACGISASGREALKAIREQFQLRLVALTSGGEGATLVSADEIDHCPAPAVDVRDTVGAGDSFTAAMALGLLNGWPLEQINQRAVAVAAYVCTQSGATPPLPADITRWYAPP